MKTSPWIFLLVVFSSCAVANSYNPNKKFSPEALKADYDLMRNALEESHPSLYWYSPKDSIDYFFEVGREKLTDSLTEVKFRNVLSYVISKIQCGHTSVRPSEAALGYTNRTNPSFPLFIKTWPDTTVVTANINRKDSAVVRGVILKEIDNKPIQQIIDSFFSHLSADGYNLTYKYQSLSNGSAFRSMYNSIYGLKANTPVKFIDTTGVLRQATLKLYVPAADSQRIRVAPEKITQRERRQLSLQAARNLKIDTTLNTAFLEVNTFTKHNRLRGFFRSSFKQIKKEGIDNLVVDIRSNGGGSVTLSNLLTKYIADKPFKIADSLYAIKRWTKYGKYQQNRLLNWMFLQFLTRRKEDGNYHFTLFENKYFKPKKKHHFDGTTYILTGGNSFSAATLFSKALIDQENVIVVGEETGGGAYGNTAWLIPDLKLPNTGVRVRLPLFRLVIDKNAEKGRGVMPEVEALPAVNAIRKGEDFKVEKVKELIKGSLPK